MRMGAAAPKISLIEVAASKPLMPGMPRSITTAFGRVAKAIETACRPPEATSTSASSGKAS